MPKVMKPPTDYDDSATNTGGDWYDGPPPKPGLYKGVVKKMLLSKVTQGEKKGEQRIMVICEISEGKFKGAGVSKWLQLTQQGSPWVNQFLHALTDGSEAQKAAIRKAFKEIGFAVDDADAKKRYPIVRIGKKTNPIGRPISFVTKMRTDDQGVERAEISRFVTPRAADDDEDEDDSDDILTADDDTTEDDGDEGNADDTFGDMDSDDDATDGDSEDEELPADDSDDEGEPWEV
ncbi:hypothetical protein SEA_WEISS13_71 [Mycobacterium phage Weiss13]|uniref:Uncharacterized protein n=4 Tax=Papyrusvirus TaxID=1982554 RepID=A0A0Y0AA80_9CAUD|nr:methyltransferase [Mycobacterium phage Papyrus]AGT14081.1 hypothetical protein PAPYRUS_71 [Mycobacterium phage Papyrus]AMB17285.1 hypothetical protein SEA_WEISS13_71 [Mycobacterium phage Weiss13]AVO21470.1 hypothetical protein PBI_NILO_73 [Mycobacterium phage Nilo]AYQ98645.1 hypothetical protein SEA_RIPARIAN_73 [Mycobacterium phage Riparian]